MPKLIAENGFKGSFLTGSRVYGYPTSESDIDLVVLVTPEHLELMIKAAEETAELGSSAGERYEEGRSIRFGKLNLLCVTEEKHFEVWRDGTHKLEEIKPVTRDSAIAFLKNLRQQHKIEGW